LSNGHDQVFTPGYGEARLGFSAGPLLRPILKSGEHIIPEAALDALADQKIPLTIEDR
jgi:hypothetical protein